MQALHNYKLWNPNLGQYVAQRDLQTAEHIQAHGGVIIDDGHHAMQTTHDLPSVIGRAEIRAAH